MNILILHRVPYARIDYARGIDHERHDVTYFGKREVLATLPPGLRCSAVERPGVGSAFDEARAWLRSAPRSVAEVFDRVISLSEYELLDAAQLREWLGVPGAGVDQVRLVRDKILMKQAVQRAGLRVPRFLPLGDFLDLRGRVAWSQGTVLKPHSGASSADVVVFESPQQAFDAISGRSSGVSKLDGERPEIGEYEVEEFVSGPVVHFDGLVDSGRVVALTASRYVGTCLGYAQGLPLGSHHIPLTDAARLWTRQVLHAVEIHHGSFHLEAIENGPDLVFLEVGNRVGGADVVATFELATGVHLPSQELRILLGEPVCLPPTSGPRESRWHGWFVYPGHQAGHGTYNGFDGADEFRNSAAVVSWNELPPTTTLRSHVTYSAHEAPLAGIVATQSPDDTRLWMESLFASARLRLDPPADLPLKNAA